MQIQITNQIPSLKWNRVQARARADAHFDFNDLENRMIAFLIFQFEICSELGMGLELEPG